MAFIKFTETGKSYNPKVSISNRGLIGFNQGARKRFEIDKYAYCVLYYDPDSRLIAFELTNDADTEGATKIRLRQIGADLGAKSFLTYFNILPEATFMYAATTGANPNWITIDLKAGKERRSSASEDDEEEETP